MAITISGAPTRLQFSFPAIEETFVPVYNPIVYYLDSDNKANEGFKYVADIYSAGTTDRIATVKVLPRPVDGLGVININQLVENEVTYTIPSTINQFQSVPLNYVNYDIEFGEEYFVEWPFTSAAQGPSFFSGFTLLSGSTLSPFITGDDIIIYPDVPTPGLEGYSNVIGSGLTSILIVTPWDNAYSAATGVVRFANGSKTVFPNLTGITNTIAWNGALSHKDFIDYTSSAYTVTYDPSPSATVGLGQWLTNIPQYYRVKNENDIYLQFHNIEELIPLDYKPEYLLLKTFIDDPRTGAAQVGEYNYSAATFSTTGITMQMVNVGPQAITDFDAVPIVGLGTLPAFPSSINFYSIQLLGQTDYLGEEYFFEINKDCFRYTNIELLFQDRLGSLVPANFELNSVRTINWTQESYDTYMGDLVGGKYAYNTYDRGTNTFNSTVSEEITIISNWVDEATATYWQELFTSPIVYIKEDGDYYPVTIKDTSKQIKKKNNEKNISYTLTIQYAFRNRIQNGK
jgi:hypothetical protein